MAINLGAWVGLFCAVIIIILMNKKLNQKVEREVKVYGESNITTAKEKPIRRDTGIKPISNTGKREIKGKGTNEEQGGIQDKPDTTSESNESKPGTDSKTDKPNGVTIPRIEPI